VGKARETRSKEEELEEEEARIIRGLEDGRKTMLSEVVWWWWWFMMGFLRSSKIVYNIMSSGSILLY